MGWFKRKREHYFILKLFKVVTIEEAEEFRIADCFNMLLEFYRENSGKYFDQYEINYGTKTWSRLESFKNGISQIESNKISIISGLDAKTKSELRISNNLINQHNPKENDIIHILFAINEDMISDFELHFSFLQKLFNAFEFDYGYALTLDSRHGFRTERIKDKNSNLESDIQFRKNLLQLNNGFVGKIYNYNFLNKKQIGSTSFQKLLENKNYDLKKLNDKIFSLKYLKK